MSLAQVLNYLRAGDAIIVRDGDALSTLSGHAAADVNTIDSRTLLRSLIAVRKVGGKK